MKTPRVYKEQGTRDIWSPTAKVKLANLFYNFLLPGRKVGGWVCKVEEPVHAPGGKLLPLTPKMVALPHTIEVVQVRIMKFTVNPEINPASFVNNRALWDDWYSNSDIQDFEMDTQLKEVIINGKACDRRCDV